MSRCALYRHFDAAGALLYVGISSSPADRMHQHTSQSSWAGDIVSVTLEHYPTREMAVAAERAAIATERPRHNTAWNPTVEKAAVNLMVAVLTAEAMCGALGVGPHAIRYARFTGKFPGNWYGTLLPLCLAAGVECPISAFTWKSSKAVSPSRELAPSRLSPRHPAEGVPA